MNKHYSDSEVVKQKEKDANVASFSTPPKSPMCTVDELKLIQDEVRLQQQNSVEDIFIVSQKDEEGYKDRVLPKLSIKRSIRTRMSPRDILGPKLEGKDF